MYQSYSLSQISTQPRKQQNKNGRTNFPISNLNPDYLPRPSTLLGKLVEMYVLFIV